MAEGITVRGTELGDELSGTENDDTLQGFIGSDTLDGGDGADTLEGGLGDDRLIGGDGNDTYIFKRGDGIDRIDERGGSGSDVIVFEGSINANSLTYTRAGNDLLVTIQSNFTSSGGTLRIKGQFDHDADSVRVETLRFSDGSEVDLSTLLVGPAIDGATLLGTDGDDDIRGGSGDDTLDGGAGDDILRGGSGVDTYLWGRGRGNDTIEVSSARFGTEVRLDDDIAFDEVSVQSNGNDLVLRLDTGETLTIAGHYSASSLPVTYIRFANDIRLDLSSDDLIPATSSGSLIAGSNSGDDLRGGDGNDVLEGNAGADVLVGGGGNDTFQWGPGSGDDVINELNGGGRDTITLDDGVTRDDITFQRVDNDLFIHHVSGDSLRIRNQFGPDSLLNRIETLRFPSFDEPSIDLVNLTLGTATDDVLTGGVDKDELRGNGGDDTLVGGLGADNLSGLGGDDVLRGGDGDDRYYWRPGDGNDVIEEEASGGLDLIVIGGGESDKDISYEREGIDLVITATSGETLRIIDQFADDNGARVEQVSFGSGGLRDISDYIVGTSASDQLSGGDEVNYMFGGSGNDTLTGGTSLDSMDGGTGDDLLLGGAGNDRYEFKVGTGNDVIDEQSLGGFDVISLPYDYPQEDLDLERSGNDLVVRLASGDTITVRNHFTDDESQVEQISAAGVTQSFSIFLSQTEIGTSGNDVLTSTVSGGRAYGGAGNDTLTADDGRGTLFGGDGDDILIGGNGFDSLIGGAGNDTLRGGANGDTYFWGAGSGSDVIDEQGAGGTDTLILTGGTTADDLTLSSDGDDLVISISSGETLRIVNQFATLDTSEVESIRLDDGTFVDITIPRNNSDNNETATGTVFGDTIFGFGGNDTLRGEGGNDTLDGGPGNDTLDGGAGTNIVRWGLGGGTDTVTSTTTAGTHILVLTGGVVRDDVTLDLSNNVLTITITATNESLTFLEYGSFTRLSEIRFSDGEVLDINDSPFAGLTMGSAGSDVINGSFGADIIAGEGGDDTLNGGSGEDTYNFEAGFGMDTINDDGGTLRFGSSIDPSQVSFSREDDDLVIAVGETGDSITLSDFFESFGFETWVLRFDDGFAIDPVEAAAFLQNESSSQFTGTAGDDTLTVNAAGGAVFGLAGDDALTTFGTGNDTLDGGDGNDNLRSDIGDDTLIGGAGNDVLNGGQGNNVLIGGTGDDTYFWEGDGPEDGSQTTVIDDQGSGNDTLNMPPLDFSPDDFTYTRNGDDLVIDVPNPFFGSLRIVNHFDADGSGRIETLNIGGDTEIDLTSVISGVPDTPQTSGPPPAPTNGNDVIQGGTTSETITGSNGDDTLSGGGGGDTLRGNNDDDLLLGETGHDTLEGGDGDDTLSGGDGNDTLDGGRGSDNLEGGSGDDTYLWDSFSGQDVIADSSGNDRIEVKPSLTSESLDYVRDGDDLIIILGEDRSIRIKDQFAATGTSQVETLALGSGETIDLTSISLQSSPVTLTGTDSSDTLIGGSGNDSLSGADGSDLLIGNRGDDTLTGGEGNDVYEWGIGQGNDTIDERLGGGTDFIRLTGGLEVSDVAFSRSGDNLIVTLPTSETLTVLGHYTEDSDGTRTSAIEGLGFEGSSGSVSILDPALHIVGTDGNDTLNGTDVDEIISGGDGSDTLQGGEGDNTLIGGPGNDTLISDSHSDTLIGGFGSDIFRGAEIIDATIDEQNGGGNDRIEFPDGITADDVTFGRSQDDLYIVSSLSDATRIVNHFSADGSNRIETLRFSDGTETSLINPPLSGLFGSSQIEGGENSEELLGSEKDERLIGNGGADVLRGESGNDTLTGGTGNDRLLGGAGDDNYVWAIGDGVDTIEEQGSGGNDQLSLAEDLRLSDLTFQRDGDDLVIAISTGDQIFVIDHFNADGTSALETIRYFDGGLYRTFDVENAPVESISQAHNSLAQAPHSAAESYSIVHETEDLAVAVFSADVLS